MKPFRKTRLGYPLKEIDVKNQNDFNDNIMQKLFGNIDFGDLSKSTSDLINGKLSLIDVQSFHYLPNGETLITLPENFKGMQFKTFLVVSKIYPQNPVTGECFIRYWQADVIEDEIDYDNATFKILTLVMCSKFYNDPATNEIYAVDQPGLGLMSVVAMTIA